MSRAAKKREQRKEKQQARTKRPGAEEREQKEQEIWQQFREKLKAALVLNNNMPLETLAQRVSLTDGEISHYLIGRRNPSWARVVLLAEKLNVEVGFFLPESPSWHFLDPGHPDTYIVQTNLAFQELVLKKNGQVRQFGTRLPLRIMREPYLTVHRNEMPSSSWRTALETIVDRHIEKVGAQAGKAVKQGAPFSLLHGLMRKGDFLKMLLMYPPYNGTTCQPNVAIEYLDSTLSDFIEKGYHFMLVDDEHAERVLAEHHLSHLETLATIGNKLAIRRTKDFAISWSYVPEVVTEFNRVFDDGLLSRQEKMTQDLLKKYSYAMRSALDGIQGWSQWNDIKVRNKWRKFLLIELKGRCLVPEDHLLRPE